MRLRLGSLLVGLVAGLLGYFLSHSWGWRDTTGFSMLECAFIGAALALAAHIPHFPGGAIEQLPRG